MSSSSAVDSFKSLARLVSRVRDEYPSRGFIDRRWHTHTHTNTLGLSLPHSTQSKTYILARLDSTRLEPRLKHIYRLGIKKERKNPLETSRLITVNRSVLSSSYVSTEYLFHGGENTGRCDMKRRYNFDEDTRAKRETFLIYSACSVARVTLLCSRAQEISHTHTYRVTHSHTPLRSSMNSLSRLRKMIGKGHDDDLGSFFFPLSPL